MKSNLIKLLAIALLTTACGQKSDVAKEIVRPVKLETVQAYGTFSKDYTGIVSAEQFSSLTFKVAGPLVAMNVEEGQKVKKGEIIAAIDTRDYELQLDANKAAYLTAKSQMERLERLRAIEAVSQQDYEIAQANYTKARSAYNNALNNLADTKLTAPFNGFVEKKFVENYQKVQPGEPIVKLVDPSRLNIKFTLPESEMNMMSTMERIEVSFDNEKTIAYNAKIKEIVDASPDGAGIPVTALIDDPRFDAGSKKVAPGFSCIVKIHHRSESGKLFVVPITAVFKDLKTGQQSVWIYDETMKTVKQRNVEPGKLIDMDKITILSGLSEGERIVIAGVFNLYEGQKVNILEQ